MDQQFKELKIIDNYVGQSKRMLGYYFPSISSFDLEQAIDYSIEKRYKDEPCHVYNDYKRADVDMNLLSLTEYILSKQPIVTNYGVLYKNHGKEPNPLMDMIAGFLADRKKLKKEMFKHPKGSDDFQKYNLLQLLEKLNANGSYGATGNYACLLYNLHFASATTSCGRRSIALVTLLFEGFLSNGVKFGSLNEVMSYFDNIIQEAPERKYKSSDILDRDITLEECFTQVILTTGFNWVPDEEEMDIIWITMNRFSQEELNRIYYKNNLYEFMENESMTKAIRLLLEEMDEPFVDPNDPPENIIPLLDGFLDILMEFVYYHHQTIDAIDRCDNMIKNVCCISDTDSAIVSLDAWYRYVLDKVEDDNNITIRRLHTNIVEKLTKDEYYGTYPKQKVVSWIEDDYDYDFRNDEIIQMKKSLNVCTMIPEEGLKFSIINIMAYVLTKLSDDLLLRFSKITNSYSPDKPCYMSLKNEFFFVRALLTMNKKNYATKQILQEGNLIPEEESLDIKGLAINKPPLSKDMRNELKKIMYEDILNTPVISQIDVIKKLAILEKKIFQSLQSGEKKYYKGVSIKSMSNYDDPMRIQGVKASIVWNTVRDDGLEAIDLNTRNAIDIVKVNITPGNLNIILDDYPETYGKFIELFDMKDENGKPYFDKGISSIAIPKSCEIPRWLTFFIDYTTIINDNLGSFPIESIGVSKLNKSMVNYTNIVQI